MSLVVRAAVAAVAVWAQRNFSDEEVVASQSFYLGNWKDHLNKGDLKYVTASYLRDAVLKLEVGPNVQGFPAELRTPQRSKEAIGAFWAAAARELSGHELVLCEDSGPFVCSTMVLDDNHVIVHGPLAFKGALRGHALSQQWVRIGEDAWKIQHDFLAFEEPMTGYDLAPASPARATPSPAAVAQQERQGEQRIERLVEKRIEEKEAAQEALVEKEREEIQKGEELAKEAGVTALADVTTAPPAGGAVAAVPDDETHGGFFYAVCAIGGATVLYFFYSHHQKRQNISDISAKSMLG